MKIAMVTPLQRKPKVMPETSIDRTVTLLSEELVREGHEVTLFSVLPPLIDASAQDEARAYTDLTPLVYQVSIEVGTTDEDTYYFDGYEFLIPEFFANEDHLEFEF